ncbi:hypothetical protein E2320_010807, partial [Naja naja]
TQNDDSHFITSCLDLTTTDDTKDTSTEFTDSIEEEVQNGSHLQNVKKDIDDNLMSHSSYPALLTLKSEGNQQVMLQSPKSMVQHVLEQKKKLEEELQEFKEHIEEVGFSSISQLKKALFSLCLENAELKEQIGEAKLSEVWEKDDEKKDKEDLRRGIKKLQEKLHTSEIVIGLLKEQLTLKNQGCKGAIIHQMTPNTALINEQERCTCHAVCDHCPPNQIMSSPEETQAEGDRGSSEPMVQQDNKQMQVDIQDLGYETCGRSETEAERDEATSPECRNHDDQLKFWKKSLEAPLKRVVKQKTCVSQSDAAAVLRQHIQVLQMQLQNSHKIIENLQSCVHSVSTTSDYGSMGDQPFKLKQGSTLGNSPSHSMTDEDEAWQSDSFGTFCPPSLQPNKDLSRLIQRVSFLEAYLNETKPKEFLPQELKCTASLGKYDSLVQAQARELSHLRQLMREGQKVCHMLNKYFKDTIKSFEELLRSTDIDYYLGQSFRKQLAEGNQLADQLARKLNQGNDLNMEDKTSQELLMRMNKELQKKQSIKALHAKLQECSVTSSNSHIISESPYSHSNISFLSDGPGVCSDVDDFSFYDDSLSKPTGLLLASLDSEPSSCVSLGPPSSCSRPLLSCCITPAFSLTEAQQELKLLQKQLVESEPSWPSTPSGM